MMRLENKCVNCADRKRCRDIGVVVTWRHCGKFRPDIELMQRASPYGAGRGPIQLNYVEREPEPELRPKKGDAVEMMDADGNVLRRFETVREAAEVTGFRHGRIYSRCNGLSTTPLTWEGEYVTFRWGPERRVRKERVYGSPIF